MSRGFANSIFLSLNDACQNFVRVNARSEDDVLPLCTYITHLFNFGRHDAYKKRLSVSQLRAIRACYHRTLPEPGSIFGIIMSKNFLQPRQQNNFDVKKPTKNTKNNDDKKSCGTGVMHFYSNDKWIEEINTFMAMSKSELLLSVKKSHIVYMSFLLESAEDIKSMQLFKTVVVDEVLKLTMCIRVMEMGEKKVAGEDSEMEKRTTEIYFVVYVLQKMEDFFIERLYNVINGSNDAKIRLIFTSNRSLFVDKDVHIANAITFIYCFFTERYRPEIETDNDDMINYVAKLVTTIIYELGGHSLKRNGMSKCGMGPLAFVIFEAGLLETAKMNGTLEYPVTTEAKRKKYFIQSIFERMFLNLPIRSGVLQQGFELIPISHTA